jgi:hypothetical protein
MKPMAKAKSRKVAVTAASVSMVLASLLGGLALLVISLRDLHLRLEITRKGGGDGRGQGPVS